jgi:aryl-alcohol dehydrogenase-like predicted oxidoreductase
MRTVELSRTGQQVSAMALGAMMFGTKVNEEDSMALLDAYVEAGGSFIDTADCYAHWHPDGKGGESELLLRKWFRDRGNREEIFLSSKVGFGYPGTEEFPGTENGLRAEQIVEECEKSLKRLGTDYIDLYFAHKDDPDTPLEETMEAFSRLVSQGKVRFLGASNYRSWRFARACCLSRFRGWPEYVIIQQKYTYLRHNRSEDIGYWPPVDADLKDQCERREAPIMAYSPLVKGAYTREDKELPPLYRSAENDARLKTLRSLAEAKGCTPNQLVLAWMLHDTPRVIPLFSVSRMEQLEEDLGALNVRLSDEEMEQLSTAGV